MQSEPVTVRLSLIGLGRIGAFHAATRTELTGVEPSAFTELVADTRESTCTVADAVEVGWIAEACTTSRQEHRPVRMSEVRA